MYKLKDSENLTSILLVLIDEICELKEQQLKSSGEIWRESFLRYFFERE